MLLVDGENREVKLGREIGRGGEGRVVEVLGSPHLAAKLYHPGRSRTAPAKILWMVKNQTDALLRVVAWPTATLHDERAENPIVGFLMPRVHDPKEIHLVYSPEERLRLYPGADFRFLSKVAINCAAAFAAIHERGSLIGDVNEKNLLLSADGALWVVDADSFQVRDEIGQVFRCPVGRPEFTPPELQTSYLPDVDREELHDRFALAVLLFQILFQGRHPFAGVNAERLSLRDAIHQHRFAYSRSAKRHSTSPPPGAPTLSLLSPAVAELFERAFGQVPGNRPSALEWKAALEHFNAKLCRCRANATHYYHPDSGWCGWCELRRVHGVEFFELPKPVPVSFGAEIPVRFSCPIPIRLWLQAIKVPLIAAFGSVLGVSLILVCAAMLPHLIAWKPPWMPSANVRAVPTENLPTVKPRAKRPDIRQLVEDIVADDLETRDEAHKTLNAMPNWEKSDDAKKAIPRLIDFAFDKHNNSWLRHDAELFIQKIDPSWDSLKAYSERLRNQSPQQGGAGRNDTRPSTFWLPATPSPVNAPTTGALRRDPPRPSTNYPYWVLGVSTQPVRVGNRTGLWVAQVVSDGAALRAGLESGDVILDAGDVPVSTHQALLDRIAQSRGRLKLNVVDRRSGRLVVIDAALKPLR